MLHRNGLAEPDQINRTPDTARLEQEMRRLHPIGRIGRPEVAAAVAHLLSVDAGLINGATIPAGGGRSVLAHDSEAHEH